MGLKKKAVLIPLTFLSLAGCSRNIQPPNVYTRLMMDTVVEFSIWGKGSVAGLGFGEIQRIQEKFSIFREDSEISRINKGLPVEMSEEFRYLIDEANRYSELTHGAFDITYRQDKKYDLGGIAKGYAVDRIADIFKENGVTRAMVNIGGNLYLIGYPSGKDYWTIGIKHPMQPDKLIGRLRLDKELGVATSGLYERPGHIINPKTGEAADGVLSVTIIAPKAMTADALSTGIFVLGRDKGMELIESLPEVDGVIIDISPHQNFWCGDIYGVRVSSGLKGRYEDLR